MSEELVKDDDEPPRSIHDVIDRFNLWAERNACRYRMRYRERDGNYDWIDTTTGMVSND